VKFFFFFPEKIHNHCKVKKKLEKMNTWVQQPLKAWWKQTIESQVNKVVSEMQERGFARLSCMYIWQPWLW